MSSSGGFLQRLSARLTQPLEEYDDAKLAVKTRKSGVDCVAECQHGQKVTIVGRVRSLQIGGEECTGLTAEIFDGTDQLTVTWLGRSNIPGIDTGRRLSVTGRVGICEGRKTMFNPWYELQEGTS